MANVDNLNFSVIINDADFDARCAAIEKRANELNTNLSNILQIDKVVGDSKAVENLKKQIEDLIKQNDILKKGNEATSQIADEMENKINEANAKIAKIQKQTADAIKEAVEKEKAAMADEASSLNAVIKLYKQMEEIKNRASVRQMAGKWGMTAEDTKLLDEYSAKYDRLMEKVNKRAEKDESFAALKEEAEAIAQAEVELQKRNMAEKEFINILRERLQIQAKANAAETEFNAKDKQGVDNSAESKAFQDYTTQLQQLDTALNSIKSQYSELGEISKRAFDIQDIGKALDYLNKMEKTAAGIEKKDLTSFNKQMKEYVSLEKQIAKLETDLNVRKVSNKNADYTNAENKKLQDHIAKQQELRAELDKLIQRYPQLKAVFDQAFNTARLEAAVEAERRIARETERVTREKERQNKAIQAGIRHTANMTTEAKKLTMETGKVTKYWNQFKNILGGATSIYAMKTILSNMMDITGEFELQRTTLRAILQDANKADVIFEKIKGLALVSPFNFKELISYTKQLSAFSIPANELYDTTKMLADLSAGLGVEMGRLILAVGQVRSAAVLRGQELRQFTESGIPLLEALRQEFERLGETGITTGQVFDKISNRLVSFEMVKKVLTDMTEEGGKFYNMQEVQSETLKGKLSNLKDAYQMMFNEIGQSQSDVLKGAVDLLKKMMANWEEIGKGILAIIAIYGSYRAALVLVRAAQMATVYANLAMMSGMSAISGVLDFLTIKFRKLWAVIMKNPYVALGVAVTAIGYAVYRLVTYQTALEKTQESLNKAQVRYNAELANEKAKLDNNISKLKTLREGTEEYEKLKNRILNTYGEYLTEVDKETIKTQGLANSYNILASAIANANKQKFYAAEENKINEAFNTMISDVETNIKKVLSGAGVSDAYSSFVMEIVKGSRSVDSIQDVTSRNIIRALLYGNGKQDTWGKEINEAKAYYENAIAKLNEIFSSYEVDTADYPKPLMNYQKKVQDFYKNKMFPTLDTLNEEQREKLKSLAWWSDNEKNNEGGETYAKKMKERYDEINNSLSKRSLLEAGTITQLENEKNEIEQINALFEGQILAEKKKESQSKENPYEKKIQEWKLEYDLLKKVQSAYEDLRNAGFGNDKISKFFSETLGADFKGLDFASQIKTITDSLRELGEEGQKAADVITNSAKKVDISEETKKMIDGVQQATERLKRLYDEFDSYIIEGNGITFDFSKILKESSKAITKIEAERKRSLEDLNTKKILLDEQAYQKEEKLIKNIYDTQIANQKKVTSEKIRELAKAIISDQNQKTSLDFMMNDISGQNIFQLGRLKEVLADAKAEIDNYTTELIATGKQALLEKYSDGIPNQVLNQLLEDVDAAVEEAQRKRENDISVTNAEYWKKWAGIASTAASKTKDFANSMIQLAEATGNVDLQNSMEALSGFADAVGAAAQGFASGGWIGAAIGGASSLIESFITGFTQAEITAHKTEVAVKNMVNELNNLKIQNLIDGTESIFGDNSLGNVRNYSNALKEISKAMLELGNVTDDIIYADSMNRKWWQGVGQMFLPVWGENWGWLLGQDIQGLNNPMDWLTGDVNAEKARIATDLVNNLANGMTKIQSMMVKTKDYGGFLEFFGAKDKYSTLGELFPDMFDKDGNIDLSKLETALATIKEAGYMLTEEQEEYFDRLLTNYQQYTDAVQGITDYLSGIFGNLADDITDKMMEAFIATGNAAIDMGDIVSSVAQQMMKDLGKSLIYSLVFDELEKAVIAMWKPYNDDGTRNEKYIADETQRTIETVTAIQNGLADVSDLSGQIAEVWQQVIDQTGINLSSTDDTLKSSIQGITEETASRLANLINGIYSEVFRQGAIFDNMNINVAAILSKMNGSVSENTYQDYLMQIQANTYDTAQNTQKMLERIDSVMASTGGTGGEGIKVYLQ